MTTVLSQKGRIVLPSAVLEQMHLQPGQDFEVFIDDEDTITLRRINRPPQQRPSGSSSRLSLPIRGFPAFQRYHQVDCPVSYLVDTKVLSELAKHQPDPGVTAWLRDHEPELCVSTKMILGS
ncbi:MAG: AbrB/MazE/SpoVT family DNA-binding domain-containing protein [Verrucomicrobiales bacterium]